jgi:hypothetical protein
MPKRSYQILLSSVRSENYSYAKWVLKKYRFTAGQYRSGLNAMQAIVCWCSTRVKSAMQCLMCSSTHRNAEWVRVKNLKELQFTEIFWKELLDW